MAEAGPVVLTFGGGIQSRRRVSDIDTNECVPPSENFDLDPQFLALVPRKPFDLVGTAPNAGSIRGYGQLRKSDTSLTTFIQAGDKVYSWDGSTGFTEVGTVNSAARLRGPEEHNFLLDDYTVVTDLELIEVVKKWDGTTFGNLNHNLGGDLKAKFCRIVRERNWLGNVTTTIATPHVVLASKRGDGEDFSNSDRPGSALGLDSAFFLPMPDLRPINGLEEIFNEFVFSTERGRLFKLTGSSALDYDLGDFFKGSAVTGDEAIANIGNDLVLGLPGRIESLAGVEQFGDVQANDLSLEISDLAESIASWRIFYDRRMEKVYAFPVTGNGVFVLHKRLLDQSEFSPWSKFTTTHSMAYEPETVMPLIDPLTETDALYFGDTSGNIYKAEGETGQDGGTDDIVLKRRTGLIQVPGGNAFDIKGWISYRKLFQTTVKITILGGGREEFDYSFEVQLPLNPDLAVYGGEHYYGDATTFYGVGFTRRITKQNWEAAGLASHFQIEVEVTSGDDHLIEEVGFTFETVPE